MASDVVQFREDADALAYLRKHGLNPNEFARAAFETALARLRAEAKVRKLAGLRLQFEKDPTELVRDLRDAS